MGWQADGIHPLGELHWPGELDQGDVIVDCAWFVVLRVGDDSFGHHLLLCPLICVSIVITHDYSVVTRNSAEK